MAQWQRVRLHAGDAGSVSESGRSPGGGHGSPLQLFLPGGSHGQRSLVGYSPWGRTESDMTERLNSSRLPFSCFFLLACLVAGFCFELYFILFLTKDWNSLFSFLYVSSNPLKYLILKYISTSIAYHRS